MIGNVAIQGLIKDVSRRKRSIDSSQSLDRPEPLTIQKDSPNHHWVQSTFAILATLVVVLAAIVSVVIVVIGSAFTLLPAQKALASMSELESINEEVTSAHAPMFPASSMQEVNRAIAAMAADLPPVPESIQARIIACGMRTLGNTHVACVLLNDRDVPITMLVAGASQIDSSNGRIVERHGRPYRVQRGTNTNIVMIERSGRWVCLIGADSVDQLIDLAETLRF